VGAALIEAPPPQAGAVGVTGAPVPPSSVLGTPGDPAPKRLNRLWRHFASPFGKVPTDTSDPSGLLSPLGRWEYVGIVASLVLGLGVGLFMVLFYFHQAVVPPGGDPGEWIAGSYQYIGEPYPSWYSGSGSPPLLFPLLGSLVVLGGGPIAGAQLFVVVEMTLFAGSTFVLVRTLTRHPFTALAVTGFVVLNPTLDSLFFSGAYQYLLSFVLLNLTIAYLVRFVRSHRSYHLGLFWVCGSLALLTQPAMIVEVPGMIILMGVALLWLRQIPKEIITTWTGRLGAALFVGTGAGWYVLLPRLVGSHQNDFLLKNDYFSVIQGTIGIVFGTVVDPFYPGWGLDPATAVRGFLVIVILVVVGFFALRFIRPGWLTLPWLTVLAWGTLQVACAYVGYHLQIVTPYSRFGELLVLPVIAAVGMAIEGIFFWVATAPDIGPPAHSQRGRWHHRLLRRIRTPSRLTVLVPAIIAVAIVVGLGFYVDVETAPDFQRLESSYANIGHDQDFLNMLGYVDNSSIGGSALTLAHATSWSRAITHRDVYAPFLPGYALNVPHILTDEEVGFALTDRYAVTNDFVAMAASGYYGPNVTAVPLYESSYFGLFFPVLRVLPGSLVADEAGQNVSIIAPTSVPSYLLPGPGGSSMGIVYVANGVNVTILSTALPGVQSGTITIYANATGSRNLTHFQAALRPPPAGSAWFNETAVAGAFDWTPDTLGTALGGYGATDGTVTPASALLPVTAGHNATNASSGGLNLMASPVASGGGVAPVSVRSLSMTITLTSPAATNFIDDLPPFMDSAAIWSSLGATLFIYSPTAVPGIVAYTLNPNLLYWLHNEFGVTEVYSNLEWQVYLLPTHPLGPAS
jgi:hypothetical protein